MTSNTIDDIDAVALVSVPNSCSIACDKVGASGALVPSTPADKVASTPVGTAPFFLVFSSIFASSSTIELSPVKSVGISISLLLELPLADDPSA